MAVTLADISTALSLVYREPLQTQINSVCLPFFLLPVTIGEGKSLNWTCEFTGAADATAVADGVALDSTDADEEDEIPATFQWATYLKVSSVSDLAQAAAGTNFNPASIATRNGDLLVGKLFKQIRRLARGFAADFYGGNPAASPAELAGAALAIDSSGTFAGINPAVETEWAATEQTSTYAGLNFQVLRDFFTAIYTACGYYPEFCLAGPTVFNAIRNLFDDFEANVVREVRTARGGGADGELPRVIELSGGMRAVMVDEVPIILDQFATANTLYALNTRYVEIQQLPRGAERSILNMTQSGVTELFERLVGSDTPLTMPRESVEGMLARGQGVMPFVKVLGVRGLSTEAAISVFCQTKWSRRNAHGKLVLS